jgi:methylmalonyl-CoA/ethylmalonyl-CoA epimerase
MSNKSIEKLAKATMRLARSQLSARPLSNTSAPQDTMAGRLNHIAIAVPNLQQATDKFKAILGVHVSSPHALPEHGVTVAFVELPNTKLELLEPTGDDSPIANFLKKNPLGGMHHMCIEVGNVLGAVDRLTTHGVRVIDPKPKIGAHGNPVVFLHPKELSGVLTEFEQV